MGAFIETFARKEMKYRLSAAQYKQLLSLIEKKLEPTEYAKSTISSLYYDTPDFQLIQRSLDKPLYKEKLRLRVYSANPTALTPAFVEIKKKFKGIVYKRRVGMTYAAAKAYLGGMPYEDAARMYPLESKKAAAQTLNSVSLQIAREIDFFLQRYETLEPAMLITCSRLAFVDKQSDLRITFDSNLRATIPPDAGWDFAIIPRGEAVMEIKSSAPLPQWLVGALSDCGAYKQSFSKYGTAYLQMMQMKKGA